MQAREKKILLSLRAIPAKRQGASADERHVKASTVLVGFARSKQDPVKHGHVAQCSYRPRQPRPGEKYTDKFPASFQDSQANRAMQRFMLSGQMILSELRALRTFIIVASHSSGSPVIENTKKHCSRNRIDKGTVCLKHFQSVRLHFFQPPGLISCCHG